MEILKSDTQICFKFKGKIDSYQSIEIENKVKETILNNKLPIIFDMKDVEFITSAFLRICLFVSLRCGVNNFKIINLQQPVLQIFKITGFDNKFTLDN